MKRISAVLFALMLVAGCLQGSSSGGSDTPPGDTGSTATSLLNNPLSGICRTEAGNIFVSSDGGKPLMSADGSTFLVLDGTQRMLNGIACDPNGAGAWFVGAGGTIFTSSGGTLAEQTSPTTSNLNSVFVADSSDVVAVGDGGTIVKFDGKSWTAKTSGVAVNLYGVGGREAEMFAVGASGTILTSTDRGESWITVSEATALISSDTQLNVVWAVSSTSEVFIAGNGVVLHRNLGAWTLISVAADLRAIQGWPDGSAVLASGANGVTWQYCSSSATNCSSPGVWSALDNPVDSSFTLTGILAVANEALYVVGSDGTDGILATFTSSGWNQIL